MSHQRRKDREAREAAAAQARKAATEAAVEQGRRPEARPGKVRAPVYRQRRFAPLPLPVKAALALGWLSVLALVLYLVPTWTGRLGF
ncbi:MAG: hypothetical protein H7323_08145, partial [Frankiales bacterium]|nr:hypothetical protein [Frankiales bacterium]